MDMPNISYKGDIAKNIFANNDYYQEIAYLKTIEDFIDYESYSKFISAIERLVRTSNDYKVFIDYIKNTIGINFCQVLSQIHDKVDANIEFHHGPIFTLYDICENELNKFIQTGKRINSFRIADAVLDLHFDLKVNGVMLCKTMHESAHNQDLFINIDQSLGDVNSYIQEYHHYFSPEVKYKLWNYIQMCKNNPSFDKGVLDIENVSSYIKCA